MSNKIRVNDQIIEVDGRSLYGYTNHEAVEVLRSAGKVVKLRLARYLRGTKFEQLQQAIASTDIATASKCPRLDHQTHPESRSGSIQMKSVSSTMEDDMKRSSTELVEVQPIHRSEEEIDKEIAEIEILPPPPQYLLQNEWTQRIGNEFIVVVSFSERIHHSD